MSSTVSPKVLILMGSNSDLGVMQEAIIALKRFQIPYQVNVSSAHRCPERTATLAREAQGRGIEVIIAGAGSAAHLAGVVAAETTLPVIGVPIDSSPLAGFDALLATVQMPAGIPVATVAVGKAGARNAGILAAQILAVADSRLREELAEFKKELVRGVEEKDRALQESLAE